MSNIYTCFARVVGLDLPPKTLINIIDYTITNIPIVLFNLYVRDHTDFIIKFGNINYGKILEGSTYWYLKPN
jgi:hypothetical protein